MNNSDIKRKARRFLRKIGGKAEFEAVSEYLQKIGYEVYFIGTSRADTILATLGIGGDAIATKKAFTVCVGAKIIFIDKSLSENDKLLALLHEAGHIVLGHLDPTRQVIRNEGDIEAEAQTFANLVVSGEIETRKRYGTVITAVAVLCLAAVAVTAAIMVRHYKTLPTDAEDAAETVQIASADAETVAETPEDASGEAESDTVYITPTGKAYHTADCRYVQKSGFEISRKEAEKHYKPCSYCHP